ncbi:hypothetical protein Q4Q66_11305, partial [Morganella morganii]
SDGAWGVNGGISVPKDNNGLELVYVDDRVQSDGDNQSSVLLPLTHVILSNVSMRIQPCKPRTGSPVLKNRLLSGAYFVSLAE